MINLHKENIGVDYIVCFVCIKFRIVVGLFRFSNNKPVAKSGIRKIKTNFSLKMPAYIIQYDIQPMRTIHCQSIQGIEITNVNF